MISIGLMFTERCNIRCRHCGVRDYMNRDQDMRLDDAIRYVDESAALAAEQNDTFSIFLSGGEVFLRYVDLLALARHAKSRGAMRVTCVTNGFWGKDPALARRWATELKDAGMSEVCFSMDDFHQEHIPVDVQLAALRACCEARLRFSIKCAVTRRTRRLPDALRDVADLLLDNDVLVHEMACVPDGSAATLISEDELLCREGLPGGVCPGLVILTILPDGTTFPCCGVGWTPELVVGSAMQEPIARLWHRAKERDLFAALMDKGPAFFVPYFAKAAHPLPLEGYVNVCHLCMAVLDHPASDQLLPAALADWRVGAVRRLMGPLWALDETECSELPVSGAAGQRTV